MSGIGFELLVILLLILANGVFALSEIALVSSRKHRLQQRAEAGNPRAAVALALADEPNRYREKPRGFSPLTPPHVRITYAAIRWKR
jgi:hypothetical protein